MINGKRWAMVSFNQLKKISVLPFYVTGELPFKTPGIRYDDSFHEKIRT